MVSEEQSSNKDDHTQSITHAGLQVFQHLDNPEKRRTKIESLCGIIIMCMVIGAQPGTDLYLSPRLIAGYAPEYNSGYALRSRLPDCLCHLYTICVFFVLTKKTTWLGQRCI